MITARINNKQLTNYDRRANLLYVKSSNIDFIAWPVDGEPLMLVRFKSGTLYGYYPVTRQRCVAMAMAESPGKYLNEKIKPNYKAAKIV